MAVKVTKSQLSDGTIPKNECHEEYYLCGKFHVFMKKCTTLPILGAMPLYHYRKNICNHVIVFQKSLQKTILGIIDEDK